MKRSILVYYILFIPIIVSNNITITDIENDLKKTNLTNNATKELLHTKNIPLMESEGGSVLQNNRTMVLPKDRPFIDLETVNEELRTPKLKPIQPRKGVGNPSGEMTVPHDYIDSVSSENNISKIMSDQPHQANTTKTISKVPLTTSQLNVNNNTGPLTPEHVNENKVHKKPYLLSSEILDKDNKITVNEAMIPLVKSSLNTLISDQIPSPGRDVKSYKMATKHPGLVTPIVITILVVPVFALLGYMSFKRGQEAWKNRHYKRMDFLLDGMYNE